MTGPAREAAWVAGLAAVAGGVAWALEPVSFHAGVFPGVEFEGMEQTYAAADVDRSLEGQRGNDSVALEAFGFLFLGLLAARYLPRLAEGVRRRAVRLAAVVGFALLGVVGASTAMAIPGGSRVASAPSSPLQSSGPFLVVVGLSGLAVAVGSVAGLAVL